MTNTKFENFNNCGAVLRNKRYIQQASGTASSYGTAYILRNNLAFTAQLNKKYASLGITPFTCSASSPCYSLTVDSTTFTDFGKMKVETSNAVWVDPNMKLKYTSSIFDLENFQGPIVIRGSTFTQNTLRYASCDVAS